MASSFSKKTRTIQQALWNKKEMIFYFGNTCRKEIKEWQLKYQNVGTLIAIHKNEITPPSIPFALDNGAYSCFLNNQTFNLERYYLRLDNYLKRCHKKPDWLLVPDKVGSKKHTIKLWNECSNYLKQYNIPLAFAVQDGMTKNDVPKEAAVIFVGGSTEWKLKTISYWVNHFNFVHIARVNAWNRLCYCIENKVLSIDGTGFFRGGINSQQSIDAELLLAYQKGLVNVKWEHLKHLTPSARKNLLLNFLGISLEKRLSTLPLFAYGQKQIFKIN